jgi:aspartyl-tRNA(Asn)/glutamyl-tRNA(Gln) amidotransferase subunit A
LPLGMQLIAPHFGERQLLETAEAFQRQTDFHQQRPEVA